jgi:hypothetical protein
MIFASFFYSPKESFKILLVKFHTYKASIKKKKDPLFNATKVGHCFNEKQVKQLAQLIRQYYSSCLWNKGDILLIDNRKVLHAGMPGSGPRSVRAMICNPLSMKYSFGESGLIDCTEQVGETLGFYMMSAPPKEEKEMAQSDCS